MSFPQRNLFYRFLQISLLLLLVMIGRGVATAARIDLNWADNSSGEEGFKIERKIGTNGSFSQIATVGANTRAYADTGLASGTSYCYRVRAFAGTDHSAYSNETCATTPLESFTLLVSKTGNGTVSSLPAGISCGSDCSQPYPAGTAVTLTATPAPGAVFSGWSGGGCTGDGPCTVALSANTTDRGLPAQHRQMVPRPERQRLTG